MGVIAERNEQLNNAIGKGKVLDVFKEIYHPNVTMQEATGESWTGLEKNFEREQQFFGAIEEFQDGGVLDSAVDEDSGVSFATMHFKARMKDGSQMDLTEVAQRKWKDGKIVHERFFYNA